MLSPLSSDPDSGHPDDVFSLGQCFFQQNQYSRVVSLFRQHNLLESNTAADLRFKHLAALALAERKEWQSAIELMGDDDRSLMSLIELQLLTVRHALFPHCERARSVELVSALISKTPSFVLQSGDSSSEPPSNSLNLASIFCSLRGRCFAALENSTRSVFWFRAAVRFDAKNFEVKSSVCEGLREGIIS